MNTTLDVYSDVELTSEVMSASSHKLIQMLFEKCLQHMRFAKNHIAASELVKKHESITKASDIISYLRDCLNFDDANAAELAKLLDSIYIFIEKSLLDATLNNEVRYIEQAEKALTILKSGWDGIA